jgi:hypothetical protein
MLLHLKMHARNLHYERLQERSLKKKTIVGLDHQRLLPLLPNPLFSVLGLR